MGDDHYNITDGLSFFYGDCLLETVVKSSLSGREA